MFSRGKLMLKAALEKNAANGGTGGGIILPYNHSTEHL